MQLRLPWSTEAPASRPPVVVAAGVPFPVDVRRHPRARRYVLRLSDEGRLRLTVPRGATVQAGLRFAAGQAAWIESEWRRRQTRLAPWHDGTRVWFRGEQVPVRVDAGRWYCGDERIEVTADVDPRLHVERAWRTLAARELVQRARVLADRHGFSPAAVSVRNQRSRWGACSPRGRITLNWRLVQMPPPVADYVILHELAHLRQPNHSRRFWREVAGICPAWREAERWLRRHGRELL